MKRFSLAALMAASAIALPVYSQPAQSAPQQLGRWITESGNLEVEVAPCGNAFCGTVVRVIANRSMSAPGAEMAPADARPALGMMLLRDLRPGEGDGKGEWKGEIYNRENGKSYSAIVTAPAADQLVIRAYVGLPLLGKTQVWRRAPPQAAAQ
ncbi:MAG: DUF2147 domain-containing protein [Comamonadaceae bacterium]|nr:MAG: DUF2147 domain-containing protein [Comamonadaceae bacterium]